MRFTKYPKAQESKDDVIARLMRRREILERALMVAVELIPRENLPVGVGPNAFAWLINQGKKGVS